MLGLWRFIFGAALVYQLTEGARLAPGTGEAGDLTGAYYMVVCVSLAILNALVWAPYLGDKVSGPLTGMMTQSTYVEERNWVLGALRWFDNHGHRRAAVCFCFWEAVRHPFGPTAFLVGLKNAPAGSWLQKIFAMEVFRFNNTKNCVDAYLILKQQGIDPRPHPVQHVNAVLLGLERPWRPEPKVVPVPHAPKLPPIRRNRRIRLFQRENEFVNLAEAVTFLPEPCLAVESGAGVPSGREDLQPESHGRGASLASAWLGRVADFIRTH